jgi:phosphate-selective porin
VRASSITLVLGALALGAAARADVVQGTVSPATAKVVIKNTAGEKVGELGGGPFQLRLPAGKFTAECTAPTTKTTSFFSLAQPTTLNINCA